MKTNKDTHLLREALTACAQPCANGRERNDDANTNPSLPHARRD
jgi:hypothetical protein